MKISFLNLQKYAVMLGLLAGVVCFLPQRALAETVNVQSYNYLTKFWKDANYEGVLAAKAGSESEWRMVTGLANSASDYVSFESVAHPGFYLRQSNYLLVIAQPDGTSVFNSDATFKKVAGLKDATWTSFQSHRYPSKYIRQYQKLRIDTISTDVQKQDATFRIIAADDCSDIGTSNADITALQTCIGSPAVCNVGGSDGVIYSVKAKLSSTYTGTAEVFAESRRRIFLDESTATNKCVNTLVDVRDYLFEGEPQQARDPGTPGLNLRIQQGAGELTALSVTPVTNPVVMFIAGDSTVADQPPQWTLAANARYTGWGGMIPKYFGNKIAIANYADSGEGSLAFRTDGGFIWAKMNARLKANDWVLIQLGHNDKTTPAATYRSRILGMITAIKAKGAFPVLVTPMIRNTGAALEAQHIYGDLNVRNELLALASSEGVPLVDLMQISSVWSQALGVTATQTYFVGTDKTHANELGAQLFAQMIAEDIRSQNFALAGFLRY